jgi:hypothetical protein
LPQTSDGRLMIVPLAISTSKVASTAPDRRVTQFRIS